MFAKNLVSLISEGKRILNIDETLINNLFFPRRKWRQHGSVQSTANKIVNPRVSLIAALDTEGDVYLSVTQVNTDSDVMRLYLSRLAMQLDFERPDWRKSTVFMLDNASYHKKILGHLKELKIQVIFTGPYSYDAAPCELLFAQLKTNNLNPSGLQTGKK